MLKRFIPLYLFLLSFATLPAQILEPVTWEVSQIAGEKPGEYLLIFKATIEEHWKVYANDVPPGGVIPTDIFYDNSTGWEKAGELEQLGRKKQAFDQYFDMELKWFEGKVVFRQPIRVTAAQATVSGFLEYQTCDAERCLPPTEVPFSYNLKGTGATTTSTPATSSTTAASTPENPDASTEEPPLSFTVAPADTGESTATTNEPQPAPDSIEEEESQSLWGYLIAGFGSGLLALLTPCVFPMIPLTVSFFTKSSSNRRRGLANALTYAASIILIFLGLGFIITYAFGPSALNAMASNQYFNLGFFVIFIIFALSFFGAFEITLPSSFVNKADSMSEKGGIIGIFFMAFTLVLVSFSCTMPIVGSLLVLIAESGAFWAPMMGLLGFALALAVPFALFAAFPGWLNSLPKSGGWLNTVKVTLGFAEVALAFKFLSVADLAYHWNFLTRDIFIAIWIIVAILLGMYLLGKIRFPGEPEQPTITIPRLFFAIISFAFAVYLVPGMWGAPVKLLSGIAPPGHYQEFSLNQLQYKLKQMEAQISSLETPAEVAELPDDALPAELVNVGHCPHELPCYFDIDRGLVEAIRTRKPILLDFTGWACVNCRKMEDHVWSDPRVWETINDDYVLISLYVDDKTALPEEYQISKYTNNKVRTIGKMWSDLQTDWYKVNSQPYYVLLDHNLNKLVQPVGYTPNVEEYLRFLKSGVEAFNQQPVAAR